MNGSFFGPLAVVGPNSTIQPLPPTPYPLLPSYKYYNYSLYKYFLLVPRLYQLISITAMEPTTCRKVEFYLEGNHYVEEFKTSLTIKDLEDYIKYKPEFIHQLQDNGQSRIPKDAEITFKYNSMESQPLLKTLKFSEFHPKKKLVFYISVQTKKESLLPPPPVYPPLVPPRTIPLDTTIESSGPGFGGMSGSLNIPVAGQFVEPVKPKIDPDLIQITIYIKETEDTRKKTLSRKLTFKEMVAETAVYLQNNSYKFECKVGNKASSHDFKAIELKTLESVFGDAAAGRIEIIRVFVAGRGE